VHLDAIALRSTVSGQCLTLEKIAPLRKARDDYNDMPVATMTLRHLSTSLR
jgi:hypothetical protein